MLLIGPGFHRRCSPLSRLEQVLHPIIKDQLARKLETNAWFEWTRQGRRQTVSAVQDLGGSGGLRRSSLSGEQFPNIGRGEGSQSRTLNSIRGVLDGAGVEWAGAENFADILIRVGSHHGRIPDGLPGTLFPSKHR